MHESCAKGNDCWVSVALFCLRKSGPSWNPHYAMYANSDFTGQMWELVWPAMRHVPCRYWSAFEPFMWICYHGKACVAKALASAKFGSYGGSDIALSCHTMPFACDVLPGTCACMRSRVNVLRNKASSDRKCRHGAGNENHMLIS